MNKKVLTASIIASSLLLTAGCSLGNDNTKSESEIRAEVEKEVRAELEKEQNEEVVKTEDVSSDSSDAPEEKEATEVSTDAESTGNVVSSVDEKSVEGYLKPLSVEAIKAYASALETGNKEGFYSIVDKHVVVNEELYYEPQFSKDNFSKTIDATTEKYGEDVIVPLVKGLSNVNVDELELTYSHETDTSASFTYSYKPEGFYTSVGVSFRYEKTDDGKFMLSKMDL